MGKKSNSSKLPEVESGDEFVDDDLDGTESLPGGGGDSDPEMPQQPILGGDPHATEFRDALAVTPNALGIHTLLEQEADSQQLEAEQATVDALEAMRALDHDESVTWRISRQGNDIDELNGYLVTWSNSQMSIERISRLLGGGKYYCKGFRRGKYFTHKSVTVAGKPLLKPGEKPVEAQGGSGDMQALLSQMMMMDERRRQEEKEYRRQESEAAQRRAESRQTLILAAMGPAASVLAAMFQGNRTDMGSILTALRPPDPMQQLAALKALIPEPAAPAPSALDTALTLMDKLKDLGGLSNSDGQVGWMDIVKEVVKAAGPSVGNVIEGAVQTAQAQATARARQTQLGFNGAGDVNGGGVQPQPAPALPNGGALPAPATSQETPMLGLMQHIPWMRAQINRWVGAAQKQSPPPLYAQLFFVEAPDSLEPQTVFELLSRSDWFTRLADLDQRVTQFESWFTELHQLLMHTLQTEYLNSASSSSDVPRPEVVTPSPAPRRVVTGDVERPMKLPSLTGD